MAMQRIYTQRSRGSSGIGAALNKMFGDLGLGEQGKIKTQATQWEDAVREAIRNVPSGDRFNFMSTIDPSLMQAYTNIFGADRQPSWFDFLQDFSSAPRYTGFSNGFYNNIANFYSGLF